MKKIITILLALAIVMSMCSTAFASELGGNKDVTARYDKSTTEDPVYNVDLNWGDLTFTYKEATEKLWQPDTHTYETTTTGSWDKTESTITVTNHSNVPVEVSMSLASVAGTGVNVELAGGNATLEAGIENNVSEARSVTGTIRISGKPDSTITEAGMKVASITVTIQ